MDLDTLTLWGLIKLDVAVQFEILSRIWVYLVALVFSTLFFAWLQDRREGWK